ncbi:MAG: hypothetical protein ABIV51_08040 [Saprospiraceae bacterium]
MKTKLELESDITEITNKIYRDFPELSKYISEIPLKDSSEEEINIKNLKYYYDSLEEILTKYAKTHIEFAGEKTIDESINPDYKIYPSSEDIYERGKEMVDIDPENPSRRKVRNEDDDTMNEKDFEDDMSGDDLDVPGAELDDQEESAGNEDEENNYYSLGGDNHKDLDEDNG